jgi:calcium-dependent protein kinase
MVKVLFTGMKFEFKKNYRDLKPENLLFMSKDPEAKLKVIDFGTSRKFDNKKRMTKRLGTVLEYF